MGLQDCRMIDLPKISDTRGNLTFIESDRHVPVKIKRVYYLYDVPGGAEREGQVHIKLEEFIIAMLGSFDVVLDDGFDRRNFHLNRSYFGIYIPRLIWRELNNFSSGSVCMVLASECFDEADYFRDYDMYLGVVKQKS